ncbi:MAG: sensor histidine kinase N-terminal domain-containing protein [Uliginosibacterium sp.]|jgi:two-component system sensor histidine kinase QseC|nr:sensor histidine kinase N-terminal domain-containing protein [Uliginosibacterium sp.]
MKRRSILLRLVIIQMLILQLIWLASSYLSYRSALTTETGSFDRQQSIVAKGIVAVAEDLAAAQPNLVAASMRRMEHTYRDAFEQSVSAERGEKVGFSPVFEVWHKSGSLLYRTDGAAPFEVPPEQHGFTERTFQGEPWHFYTVQSHTGLVTVTLGESLGVRRALFKPPLKSLLINLLVQFGVFLLISWLALRIGLRPLRDIARELTSRSRLDLRPVAQGENYRETRPLVMALNDMMRRVAAMLQHEKAFLADAAHELRTPITTVRTQLHVLLNARDETERTEVAHEIEAGLDRASSLTHQLITMARVESDAYSLHPTALDLAELVQDCIALAAPAAVKRRLELAYTGPGSAPAVADAAALQSVLNNLLENAIKYNTAGGQIEVSLQTHASKHQLVVRDDGPGVPDTCRARLFERFYRVPGVQQAGSGLGLAIVKNLVVRHGGSIEVIEGLSGRGIGFAISLPAG